MAAFLTAYDMLAADRNEAVDPRLTLPRSRTISRQECLRLNPLVDPADVTGGAVWHDYQLQSPERLAIGLLDAAVQRGVTAANYIEAQRLLQQGHQLRGVQVRDMETSTSFDIRCRIVVNAAGPWAWSLLRTFDSVPNAIREPRLSLALNLVTDRPPLPNAVGGLVEGRFLFVVPWREQAIVGTSHDDLSSPNGIERVDAAAEKLLRAARAAFPRFPLDQDNVRLVHRGLLPASSGGSLLKHTIVHDHQRDGVASLVTIVGVRYTTARATAAAVAELVAAKLGKGSGNHLPSTDPIAGGDVGDLERFENRALNDSAIAPSTVRRLIRTYGTRYTQVVQLMNDTSTLASPLGATCQVTGAEVLHAVRHEMAIHLGDVLFRRTEAGTGGDPGDDAIRAAANLMAAELGWSSQKTEAEKSGQSPFPNTGQMGTGPISQNRTNGDRPHFPKQDESGQAP